MDMIKCAYIWCLFGHISAQRGLKPGFLLYRDRSRELRQVCNSLVQRLHNDELNKYRTHNLKYYAAR